MFYPVQTAAHSTITGRRMVRKELDTIYYGREKQSLCAVGCARLRYREHQAGLFV